MIKSCHPEEELPQRLADHPMCTLLLAILSAHRVSEKLLNQEGQMDRISSTCTLMMLLKEDTLMGPDTTMTMTCMKESLGITRTLQVNDQLEVSITVENLQGLSKKLPVRISNLPSKVLGEA